MDASWFGLAPEDGQFLDLECDIRGAHGSIERLYVRDHSSLLAFTKDGSFIILRPPTASDEQP